MFATLSKINDWFETFRHAEGRMDFLWTFKVPKYNIIVDAKAGLLNRAIQIVLVVFVIVFSATASCSEGCLVFQID